MKKSALVCVLLLGASVAACAGTPQAKDTTPVAAAPVKIETPAPAANVAPAAGGDFALFQQAMARVRAGYVRPVQDSELIDGAIQGMVSGLDPHSSYLNAKTYSNMLTATRGQFGGIGLVMEPVDGLIKVITAKDGTPAAKAGIKTDDKIAAIDGASVD
ncbi:MAG TPA: PDZ domain-containing protein, partial [Rhizomicrobium sp.]|nr:PDZ domain-containing protein [Rhizomicrobium sp.]